MQLTGEAPPPEGDIPFNLDTLRRHFSDVILARRVLAEDVALRQHLLEQSVYNVAVERMKHQADMLDTAPWSWEQGLELE